MARPNEYIREAIEFANRRDGGFKSPARHVVIMPSFHQRAARVRVLTSAGAANIVNVLTDRGRSVADRQTAFPCVVLSRQQLRIRYPPPLVRT